MRSIRTLVQLLVLAATLSIGCSSGSSGSATAQGCWTHYTGYCTTGFFIVIDDAPIDSVDEFRITFTAAELVSGEDSFPFFTGAYRVDLLSFAERGFLLASRDDVPGAVFDRIRFHVADLEIVPAPAHGQPQLPDDGYIEVELFEPVVTRDGLMQGVRVDFDVASSLFLDDAEQLQLDPLLIPYHETGEVPVTALRARVIAEPEIGQPVQVKLAAGSGSRALYSESLPQHVSVGDWIEVAGWIHPDATIDVETWVTVESGEPELRPSIPR